MTVSQAFFGNDVANQPQGTALSSILAELRVISFLLQTIASGRVSNDDIAQLRADQYIEPAIGTVITPN